MKITSLWVCQVNNLDEPRMKKKNIIALLSNNNLFQAKMYKRPKTSSHIHFKTQNAAKKG